MFIAEFTGEAFNKMKKAGFPFPLLLFILLFLVIFPECRSRNSILFYKPFGTTQEIYKKNSDIHITVYPYEGFAKGSVIFIHGGGWQMGGSDLPFYGDWEILLKKAGLRAFSIEHRTAPHYRGKEIIQDCMDAVRYINQNADRFKIPKNKFSIIGFSSGGHLALMSAFLLNGDQKEKIPISSVVAYYSPLNLSPLFAEGSSQVQKLIQGIVPLPSLRDAQLFQKSLDDLSPYYAIPEKMMPVLLIHGKRDRLVPYSQSDAFFKKTKRMHPGKVKLILVEKGGHSFNVDWQNHPLRTEKKAVKFIKKNM